MSIGLIFIVVFAFILVGTIFRKERQGKPPGRNDGYDPSLFAMSNPDLINSNSDDGRSHNGFHKHGHSGHGHSGGTHDSGGFGDDGGHFHGGDTGGGDAGGGDAGGGGD